VFHTFINWPVWFLEAVSDSLWNAWLQCIINYLPCFLEPLGAWCCN